MADQWTHIHIFLRQRMLGGTLFERCLCGRARSPVMTDWVAGLAERAAGATMSAVMVGYFRRVYAGSVFDMLPNPSALARFLNV